jgi:rhamnosyltransferase
MQVVVVDSGSTDGSLELSQQAGFTVLHTKAQDFNHGATRQWALDQGFLKLQPNPPNGTTPSATTSTSPSALAIASTPPEFIVFLTQDAILASPKALEELLQAFQDPQVAAAYGRQLPNPEAHWLEAHTRSFNYPDASKTVQLQDKASLGIKACFLSNSFAAYRLQALMAQGGFPAHLPLGEDTFTAAKFLLSGQSLRYQATAAVYHSHNYNNIQDFQRMFDTGVFHAQNPWLLQSFGKAEGEGLKLVRSQWSFLMAQSGQVNQPPVVQGVLQWLTSNAFKWLGYKLGHVHRYLPTALVKKFSMHKAFWNTPAHASSGQSHP